MVGLGVDLRENETKEREHLRGTTVTAERLETGGIRSAGIDISKANVHGGKQVSLNLW